MPSDVERKLEGVFYLAQAEAQDAEKLQPGEYLAHTNDVQEVINKLQERVYDVLGIEWRNDER